MATHTDAPPPYTPGTPEFTENTATTIEQVEAAHRATRLQRYVLEIIAYFLPVDMPKLVKAIPFEWPTYNGFRASLLQKKECAHLLHFSQTHTKHIPNKHSLQHHEHTCHNMSTRTGENQHELDILNKKSELKLQEMKWQTIHLLVMCIGGIICVLIVCLTQDGFESSECLL
jgi:ABC-type nickel/cobalt efflux system permease component RcnA